MKNITFFREKKEIKEADYKDLVQGFTLMKQKAKTVLFNYGDEGDQFFVIVKGSVKVHVRNQTLKNWKQQRVVYQRLLDWKKELDKKYEAKLLMRKSMNKEQIRENTD